MTFKLSDLTGFTGSSEFYQHSLVRGVVYTEGVQALAEGAGAYWLIDKIATNQFTLAVAGEEFQVWILARSTSGDTWILQCEDGNDNVVYRESIEYSDFPIEPGKNFKLWCVRGEQMTIMLPSEY
jgi:predicted thioredoxin/glutaredoxin